MSNIDHLHLDVFTINFLKTVTSYNLEKQGWKGIDLAYYSKEIENVADHSITGMFLP